jgi:ABC-type multidrug transport system fused ATPase/permease subunit
MVKTEHPIIFKFDTEVTINVDETKILAKYESGTASIDSQNIDSFSYSKYWEARFSPANLWFRFVGISVAIMLFTGFISDSTDSSSVNGWVSFLSIVGILVVLNILFFFLFMLDAMMRIGIFAGIIKSFFSNHVYSVIIGNMSGNNIEFITLLNEKDKIIKLEQKVKEVKEDARQKKMSNPISNSSDLDELNKLGQLYKDGILTKEEFIQKKEEMLKVK